MNNKPYFENVYIYGDLYLDKVLLEYDFFSYSILKDNKDKFFVCYCYEVEKRQSWLINEIELNNLISFLLNEIDIKNAFLLGDNKKIIITKDYDSGKEKSMSVDTNKIINMDILPDENEFLDKKEELNDYINLLNKNIQSKKQFGKDIWMSYSSYLIIHEDELKDFSNDSFVKIHKKINNINIVGSSLIVNNINLGKSVITSFVDLSLDKISESKIKEDKNYAKAT